MSISALRLEFVDGPEAGRQLRIADFRPLLVGRGREADIRLAATDESLSRRQAYIELSPWYCLLTRVAGSSPVVELNRRAVADQCVLSDGDLVRLGATTARVSLEVSNDDCFFCGMPVECESLVEQGDEGGISVFAHETCVDLHRSMDHVVGRYEVGALIAEGTEGRLYRVYHRPSRRIWALRLLTVPSHIRRFPFELGDLQTIRHPNIIRFIEANVTAEGMPYTVSEYARAGTISDVLGTLPEQAVTSTAVRLVDDALHALACLHDAGRVHGRLTPGSLLVQKNKTFDASCRHQGKLAGLGGQPSRNAADSPRVDVNPFAAPEAIGVAHRLDGRADVYSVGVILYFLLAKQLPFRVAPDDQPFAVEAMKHGDRVPLRTRRPDLSALLSRAIDRACSPAPKHRFDSAADFRHALSQAI